MQGFHSVGQGVPEVEQRPQPFLPLVPADDLCLDPHVALDHRDQRLPIELQEGLGIALELLEEIRIPDRRVLDDLGEPGRELARRQSS